MGRIILVIAFGLCVVFSGVVTCATWYVDCLVPDGGDGKSWPTAFKKIQEGIDAASHGDKVIVAPCTYVENIKFNGKNIVLTSTNPNDPGVVKNTIIDGNQAGSVVTFSGTESPACVLSGFSIRNGKAAYGGGVLGGNSIVHTHARVQNSVITGNKGSSGGGALCYCDGAIENNHIHGNRAGLGGGLWLCNGIIRANVISNNEAVGHGGGLSGCGGIIEGNTMFDNLAQNGGGALEDCDGWIRTNTISDNHAHWGGGLSGCEGTVVDNIIRRNTAVEYGGGLYDCNGSVERNRILSNSADSGGGVDFCGGTIASNLIAGNYAATVGGGVCNCNGKIVNNTIVGNRASDRGGGLYPKYGTILNCIVWGNSAAEEEQISGAVSPTYSCIQDWTGGGEGNISSYPDFVDADGPDNDPETYQDNNYHLWPYSPCIDAGKNEDWMKDALDLDGNPRVCDGDGDAIAVVDMGAYEYCPVVPPAPWITGIEPAEPFASCERQWITINGSGFILGSRVILRFGGGKYPIAPGNTTFVSSTQIKVFVCLNRPGAWSVQVCNPDDGCSNIFQFMVKSPTPEITGKVPQEPRASAERQWMTINGTSLYCLARVFLWVGGSKYKIASDRTEWVSSTEMKVLVLLRRPGLYGFQVENPQGVLSSIFEFTADCSFPGVTGIVPAEPHASASMQWITINGNNFFDYSVVFMLFGEGVYRIPADRTKFVNGAQIDVLVLLKRPGPWGVKVNNADCQSNVFAFTVAEPIAGPAPSGEEISEPDSTAESSSAREYPVPMIQTSVDAYSGELVLSWQDLAGMAYQVEVSGDLQKWFAASEIMVAPPGGLCLWRDAEAAGSRCRFYRLFILPK